MIPKGLVKGVEGLEIGGRAKTIQTIALLRSGKFWDESWGLNILAVSQTPVKNDPPTLVWNGCKECTIPVMKSGKRHLTDGMELPNQDKIRTLGEKETYKYLGILEADTIKQVEMKEKTKKEYLRRTRKLLEKKLCSRNRIKGINTWAVSLVRYSGPFLKWTRKELKQMDQRTRKLMTMHKSSHPRADINI